MIRKEKVIVSACLTGQNCRYDGGNCKDSFIEKLHAQFDLITVCPEELGGLNTPRPPAEINVNDGKSVLSGDSQVLVVESGKDVSREFINGAKKALEIAQKYSIKKAYLKQNSPSCGCGKIYIRGKITDGDGVTVALFKQNGIEVIPLEGKTND